MGDYYTLTFDDDDHDGYEEDSFPGVGSRSPSHYLSKLPSGILPYAMPEVQDVKPATTRGEEEGRGKE